MRGVPRIGSRSQSSEATESLGQELEQSPASVLTASDFDTKIAEATAAHAEARIAAEEAHKSQLLDLMSQRREAEDRAAARVDEAQADRARRLAAALRADREVAAAEPEPGPSAAEVAFDARIDPYLTRAAAFAAGLQAFETEYGSLIKELQASSHETLMDGQPTSGIEASASHALVTSIERLAQNLVEEVARSKRNLEEQRGVLQRIARQTGGVLSQERDREVNQALHELDFESTDKLVYFNNVIRGVVNQVEVLRERQASVVGIAQPAVEYDTARGLARAQASGSVSRVPNDELPQPDVNYSVFA